MKKKELMDFIERSRAQAIKKVKESYAGKIHAAKEDILSLAGYANRIRNIQMKLNDLHVAAAELVLDMKENVEVRYNDSYNVAYYLGKNIGPNYIMDDVIRSAYFDGGYVQRLKDMRDREVEEVGAVYEKVRIVAQAYPRAHQVAAYLKGLGFDLSPLEAAESQALMVQIDTSKLLLK